MMGKRLTRGVGLIFFLFWSPFLSALTVLQLNLEQMTRLADRVFVGRCASVQFEYDSGGRSVHKVTFDVEETLKGEVSKRIVFRQLGAPPNRKETREAGVVAVSDLFRELPRYQVGEKAVLFLSAEGRLGLTAPVGLFQGKFSVIETGSGQVVLNGIENKGLFLNSGQNSKLKMATLNSREKKLVSDPQSNAEIPYEDFISLIKKIAAAP